MAIHLERRLYIPRTKDAKKQRGRRDHCERAMSGWSLFLLHLLPGSGLAEPGDSTASAC